jgi:hypothetical protein
MNVMNTGADINPVSYSRNQLLLIMSLFPLVFIAFGLMVDSPETILRGLFAIVTSRDTLVTDYIGLGGMGAAFINAGLLTLMAIAVYYYSDATIGGAAIACLFLVLGFGLFGKNILNVWFIVLGVYGYAKYKQQAFSTHINVAFFGAALAPIFSEILFSTLLPIHLSLPLSIFTTLTMGFVLAPAAAQLFKSHMGFTLYNIGFVAGVIGSIVVALYKSYGFVPDPVFIWTTGNNGLLGTFFAVVFAVTALGGYLLDRHALANEVWIMRQPGQSPTDFISGAGIGPTLFNMGLTGAMGMAYVLLVGSDLNGPTIGAIMTVVGFSAFGKNPKNILPVMIGVFIGSLAKPWDAGDPSAVLAALFGTTLAPIAGRFGWHWGVVAGFIHVSVAQTVGQLHGGLVLYNNGFAAGLVAAILVPVIFALQPEDTQSSDLSKR